MANTTNYNWETPDDTDLVKDGAAAIRTLGSSVDTTTKALNPSTTLGDIEYRSSTANTNTRLPIGTTGQVLSVVGGVPAWATSDDANAIQNAIVDAKGDIVAASAADTPARLAVGTDNQRLVAASGEATGLKYVSDTQNTVIDAAGDLLYGTAADTIGRLAVGSTGNVLTVAGGVPTWAAPAGGGGMTLINTGGTTLSGASVSISTIPSTYKKLEIFIVNPRPATDAVSGTVRFNGSSTANTYFNAEADQADGGPEVFNANAINWSYTTDNGTQAGLVHITIPDYANSTTWKFAKINSIVQDSTTPTSAVILTAMGVRNNTEAISSLEFLWSSGNGTSGTIYVYGVN